MKKWFEKNPYPSLFNPYSGTLLAIMLVLLIVGGFMLFYGNLWGAIPFIFGGLMFQGFKQPEEESPRKVWLLTCLGQMTTTKVDQLTLVLDWLPVIKVIGYVEINMAKVDHDFNMKKPILCSDDNYVDGLISISMVADEEDDSGDPTVTGWKSGGEKLRDFQNAGGMDGVKSHLDDMLTAWVDAIAQQKGSDGKYLYDSRWMETHGQKIDGMIRPRLEGKPAGPGDPNPDYDDARGLGIKFTKFITLLKADTEVIKARKEIHVQKAKRSAELTNTKTVNHQIAERVKMYTLGVKDVNDKEVLAPNPGACPPLAQIRKDIFEENLEHDGKAELVMNRGGVNVVEKKR